jgi:hypothetical protein
MPKRVLLNSVARTATITIEIVDAKMSNALICRPKRSSGVSSMPKSS